MVRMLMMQSMAIYPGDRIYIKPEDIIADCDGFYEPFLIVERTMSNAQMKNIGQVQAARKPAKDKIDSADHQSGPRSQMRWGEIHTSQHVQNDNQIAREIVYFHKNRPPVASFKQK